MVYGISDDAGVAQRIVPIDGEPFDACRRRLLQILDNHVEPRIAGVRMLEVPIERGGYVLVVRVPNSFEGPHRFNVRGRPSIPAYHRFVKRNHSLIHDMDYTQLRDAFGRTATLVEKARAFRRERIELLSAPLKPGLAGMFSHPFGGEPSFCIHLLPLVGFASASPTIDVASVYHRHDISFVLPGGFTPQKQANLYGLLMTSPGTTHDHRWMVRLFRNGAFEYHVRAARFDRAEDGGAGYLPAIYLTGEIRRITAQLLDHARDLGLEGPALLSLTGIASGNYQFRIERNGSHYGNAVADRDLLMLPDRLLDDLSGRADVDAVVQPMLDEYWQCFGEVKCELYDTATGQWMMVR